MPPERGGLKICNLTPCLFLPSYLCECVCGEVRPVSVYIDWLEEEQAPVVFLPEELAACLLGEEGKPAPS